MIDDAALRAAGAQRVVEVGDRDVVFAFVVISRTAQIIDRNIGLELERRGGIGDDLGVIALLVPADRAPEIGGCELLAGKNFQRDDLAAGVDLLVGRRGVGGAQRPELPSLLGLSGRRPQGRSEHGQHQDRTAHELVLEIRALRHCLVVKSSAAVQAGRAQDRPFPRWADGVGHAL
jgi:hypothetical protein